MPFNTYTFILFFLIVLLLYCSTRNWVFKKSILLISSYLFYAAWNPFFILLLFFSTICDWILARKIYTATLVKTKKALLISSIAINIGLLGYFKYSEFLLNDMLLLLANFNIQFSPVDLGIILPVGISFYTFQTLSYSIDVYRGKIEPGSSFLDYALYVSFFPQLVAGPIVRAGQFLPQCRQMQKIGIQRLGWGLALTMTGLFMKVVFADALLAPVVERIYEAPQAYGRFETWAGIFAYSGQIFFDFAGYSTCAVGLAYCLGFDLPHNFKAPYAAIGFSDFWRRWHITLSTWFRDYLYIAIGGNRSGKTRTAINLLLVMLLVGLWHGASWMFVIWGGMHGLYLLVEKYVKSSVTQELVFSKVTQCFLIIFTFLVVSLTWVFFRAPSLEIALLILGNIFHTSPVSAPIQLDTLLALSVSLLLVGWQISRREKSFEQVMSYLGPMTRGVIMFFQISLIYLFSAGDDRAFIYFQF